MTEKHLHRCATGLSLLLTAEEKDKLRTEWDVWMKLSPTEKRSKALSILEKYNNIDR